MPRVVEKIPARPFADWLNDRLVHLTADPRRAAGTPAERGSVPPLGPLKQLAAEVGWHGHYGERLLYRHRRMISSGCRNGVKGDYPTETFSRTVVEDALEHAGTDVRTVYGEYVEARAGRHARPREVLRVLAIGEWLAEIVAAEDVELEPDAFCSACRDRVTPIGGVCPWCDTPTADAPLGRAA